MVVPMDSDETVNQVLVYRRFDLVEFQPGQMVRVLPGAHCH
jgi:hypothetical protein